MGNGLQKSDCNKNLYNSLPIMIFTYTNRLQRDRDRNFSGTINRQEK